MFIARIDRRTNVLVVVPLYAAHYLHTANVIPGRVEKSANNSQSLIYSANFNTSAD